MMTTNYESVRIEKDGRFYAVSWYEWQDGQGRDCGLNRTQTYLTKDEAEQLAASLKEVK